MPVLAANPCLRVCDWAPTGTMHDALALFECSGCGSQWVRSQAWTPARADGTVAPSVAAEAARRGGGPPPPQAATSDPDVGEAGSAGR